MNRRSFLKALGLAPIAAFGAANAEEKPKPAGYGLDVDVSAIGGDTDDMKDCFLRLTEAQIQDMQRKGLLTHTLL